LKRLQALRQQQELSVQQLAKKAGLWWLRVQHAEEGDPTIMPFELEQLSSALRWPLERARELLDEVGTGQVREG
jgi:transcriptional regulator with XRE-family HTH domain